MHIVDTYTVIVSFGKPMYVTASKGFPIPYTTQLTNPMKEDLNGQYWGLTLPQDEPNGLYTGTTMATWVLEVRHLPGGGVETAPFYSEPDVLCFTHPVDITPDGRIVDPLNQQSSVPIKLGK